MNRLLEPTWLWVAVAVAVVYGGDADDAVAAVVCVGVCVCWRMFCVLCCVLVGQYAVRGV